ncbi:sensor histidine kinase [Rothia nasimurium]|uniref:sensor histidine kinase n=1 Tax=Rothia nasimurium TaxID=85336 RepID=UPI001F01CF82|nr:histidine kinase [Rothia nasimurium]
MTTSPHSASSKKWFPLGPFMRALFICLVCIFIAVDLSLGVYENTHTQNRVWAVAIAYLPVFMMGFGLMPGIYGWYFSLANITVLYNDSSFVWAGFSSASILVPVYCAYLATKRQVVAFGIVLCVFVVYPGWGSNTLDTQFITTSLAVFSYITGLVLRRFRLQREKDQQKIISIQEAQLQARNDERTRLAYELHDIVAHEVTIIAMQARRAQFAKNPESTAAILTGIGDSASQALEDLRKLVTVLRAEKNDSPEGELPSAPQTEENLLLGSTRLSGETTSALALTHDLHKISDALDSAGFPVTLTVIGDVSLLPLASRQALRRTAREIGTNILKHGSSDGPVKIDLTVGQRNVMLSSENVISHNEPVASSLTGLESMKTRFHDLGGTLSYQDDGGVWRIQVSLPLPKTMSRV